MGKFIQRNPSMITVLIILKKLFMDANLMNRFEGGIDMYCLFLMVASYIKHFRIDCSCYGISYPELLEKIVTFYTEQFNSNDTVINFKGKDSCFVSLADFKKGNSLKEDIKQEDGNTTTVEFVRPFYIVEPMRKRLLTYGFEKTPYLFLMIKELRLEFFNLKLQVEKSYNKFLRPQYRRLCIYDSASLWNELKLRDSNIYAGYFETFKQFDLIVVYRCRFQ
jgi:hypothetical protein